MNFVIFLRRQETVRHSPIEKLCFSFVSALAFHYLCSREDRMRLGIAKSENFVFRLSLLSSFTIFASTTCKVSRFYEKLDMFILKKIDKKDTFYAAEDEIRPLWKYVSGA